ncbi:MAG: flippase-like domain-containing protein, partial [Lachnospiraceae bacterium]|nr:flippase-like domain-containing protein [Lachnospiraceae bacterium]
MNEKGQDRKKKKIWTILFVLINIAVIAATAVNEFSGQKGSLTALRFTPRAWLYLGCTAACLAVLMCAEALKYLLMMRSLKEKVSFRLAFETAALGKYYDCITPSGAGGQPFQILWLHRHGYSDGAASAMTITGYVTMQA